MAHPYRKTGGIIDKLSHFVMHMIIICGYLLKYIIKILMCLYALKKNQVTGYNILILFRPWMSF